MDFLKLVEEARTCRRFDESKPLTESDLRWLLECARRAPSAKNAQELRFITIGNGPVLNTLFPLTRWAGALKDWPGPAPGERPTAFLALLLPAKSTDLLWIDLGICAQTMQLAATSKGWGACMIQSFQRVEATELLKVPGELKIGLLMAFGVAVEKRKIEPMPENGTFVYWRDAQGTHHVPKRDLSELIVGSF